MRLSRAERSVLVDWWFTVDRVLLASHPGRSSARACCCRWRRAPRSPSSAGCRRSISSSAISCSRWRASSCCWPCRCSRQSRVRRLSLAVLLGAFALMALVVMVGRRDQRRAPMAAPRRLFAAALRVRQAGVRRALGLADRRERAPPRHAGDAARGRSSISRSRPARAAARRRPDAAGEPGVVRAAPARRQAAALVLRDGCRARRRAAGGLHEPRLRALARRSLLHPSVGDSFQTDRALQSFIEGGFFGKGPGEGTIKTVLPDAHTDFIFAVIAEEYGVLACLVHRRACSALVAVRVFSRHVDRANTLRSAGGGGPGPALRAAGHHQHGGQRRARSRPRASPCPSYRAAAPPCLRSALTMGMLLAVTRRRPDPAHVKKPGFVSRPAT